MIRLTRSDLADLVRYPPSLQQSALAIWGGPLVDTRALSSRFAEQAHPGCQNHHQNFRDTV